MRKIFYILVTAHCSLVTVNAQPVQQEWVRRFNDTSSAAWQAFSVKSDSMGFIYVLAGPGRQFGFLKYDWNGNLLVNASYWPGGYSSGGGRYFDVSPNGDVYIVGSVEINLNYWIYTTKFTSGGAFQWGRLYNNGGSPADISVDKAGNVIIVGSASIGGTPYALTIKYNPSGDTLWTRYFNLPPNYPANNNGLTLDDSNNIFVTGSIVRPGVPGKCLILRYDPSGNLKWFNTFTIDSTRSNGGHGICLDVFGNICVVGAQILAPYGDLYTYLLRVTNAGSILWSRIYPVPIANGGAFRGPVVSRDGSSIYYTISGANGLGGGGYSIFTLKYNSTGDTQWVRVFGGGGVYGTANGPGAIKLDKHDNIYICGGGNYPTTGDDFVTIKYTPSGVQQWVMRYTGIITNGGEGAADLFIDTALNVYVVGNSPNGISIGRAAVTIKYSQLVGIISNNGENPREFKLYQNYPNPFNQSTIINYQAARLSALEGGTPVQVTLKVYDLLGREVAVLVDEKQGVGSYSVRFDASELSSGIYFYRMRANENIIDTKKLILIK
jgi:hypothetical protein